MIIFFPLGRGPNAAAPPIRLSPFSRTHVFDRPLSLNDVCPTLSALAPEFCVLLSLLFSVSVVDL